MKSNRLVTILVILGVVIAGVTFLGAAHMLGDDASSSKDTQKSFAPGKSGGPGVVVYGTAGLDNGVDLLQLYPETFPQPSTLKKVLVVEGQKVVKGEKLAEFDTKFADLNVAEAKAGLAMAEAAGKRAEVAVDRANAALLRANAAVDQAKAAEKVADQTLQAHEVLVRTNAKTVEGKEEELSAAKVELQAVEDKLRRAGIEPKNDPEYRANAKKWEAARNALDAEKIKLEGMKAIRPTSKKDEAIAGIKQAEAGVKEAEVGIKEAQAAVAEANAAVAKQQVVLDRAQYGLTLTTLTAPDDGTIIRMSAAAGMTLGPQTRQPVFLFEPKKGNLIVRAEVDQEFASRVAVGQAAVIHDDGNPNLKWTGKVLRVSDAFLPKRSNPTSPEGLMLNDNRVLECIVSIEGGDLNFPIRIGQRVKVSIGVE